jgi:hypothetical protein
MENNVPTVIVDFEHENRGVPKLDSWCRGFLRTVGVRQVIGIKIFPRNNNGEVAALAIQYGYNNSGQVVMIDVVSFGQRDVVLRGIIDNFSNQIRFLPHPTQAHISQRQNPWPAAGVDGFLTIPRAECIFGYRGVEIIAQGNNLQLDLFRILCSFLRMVQ